MKKIDSKSINVPNNYAGCLTLLQAMSLLALLGLALAGIASFLGL